MINREIDIRRMLPFKNPRYIEPATGSTFGVPDVFVIMTKGKVMWLELKLARWILRKGKPRLIIRFKATQRIQLPKMVEEGAQIYLVVGVVGTKNVFLGKIETLFAFDGLATGDVTDWITDTAWRMQWSEEAGRLAAPPGLM
jgi:hypothetical protein